MEHLIAALKQKKIVLFVGAGVSMNLGLLSWKGLINKMAEDLGFEHEQFASFGDYLALAERRISQASPDFQLTLELKATEIAHDHA